MHFVSGCCFHCKIYLKAILIKLKVWNPFKFTLLIFFLNEYFVNKSNYRNCDFFFHFSSIPHLILLLKETEVNHLTDVIFWGGFFWFVLILPFISHPKFEFIKYLLKSQKKEVDFKLPSSFQKQSMRVFLTKHAGYEEMFLEITQSICLTAVQSRVHGDLWKFINVCQGHIFN